LKPEDVKTLLATRDRRFTDEEYRDLATEYDAVLKKMAPIIESCRKAGTSPTGSTEYDELRHLAAPMKDRLLTEDEDRSLEGEREYLGKDPKPGRTPTDTPRARGAVKQPYDSLGEQLRDVANAYKGEMRSFDPRLEEVRTISGLSESVPSDMGFLVQTDHGSGLLKRTYETGVLAGKIQRVPISAASNGLVLPYVDETSRADGSRFGGIRAYWEGEAALHTKSAPKVGEMRWTLRKLTGLFYSTDELLADVPALGALVNLWFGDEFGFKLDDGVYNGTGAGQPKGILPSNCLVTVAKETGQKAKTILFENVANMWSRVWARSRTNGFWVINQDCEPQLMSMYLAVGTGGVPVYLPANGLSGQPYGTLFSRPVLPLEQAQTLGTVGDIAFVDPTEYLGIEKGGIQSASSIHVRFLNDETVFRFVYRFDGQPLWRSALTPKNGSNTLSPFVALATRA